MTTNRVLYALLAVLVAVLVGVGILIHQSSDTRSSASSSSQIVHQLQAAEAQRDCQATADRKTFAAILDLLADNFATPPAPDPARLKAVASMRATAELFRSTTTPTCPGR